MDKYAGINKAQIRLTNNSIASNYSKNSNQSNCDNFSDTDWQQSVRQVQEYSHYTQGIQKSYENQTDRRSYGEVCELNQAQLKEEPLYMIREYDWGNGDEVVVYNKNKRTVRSGFYKVLARVGVSLLLFLSLFAMSKSGIPQLVAATQKVKEAIIYDYDKSEGKELGEVRAVSLIKQEQEKKKEE